MLMLSELNNIIVKQSFETVLVQLEDQLHKAGFEVASSVDLRSIFSVCFDVHYKKYKIIQVLVPRLVHQMLSLGGTEGAIIPCQVTVYEAYPGETVVVPLNPMEHATRNSTNPVLRCYIREVSDLLEQSVLALRRDAVTDPDLVTSWQ
jgi:uncharacterized protein (DUF302 family)